jgi:hypothetical protein
MVHALNEIRHVLSSNGMLIDLRPLADRWPVEIISNKGFHQVGRLLDDETGLADDQAANRAITQAAEQGWFVQEKQSYFPFFYYWDTPNEMQEYIEKEWEGFNELEQGTLQAARSVWASAGAEARPRVRMKMQITRLRKANIT